MIAFLTGALVGLPLAIVVWWRGRVTAGGAATGVMIAGVTYAGMYLAGLLVVFMALMLTLISSRVGRVRKQALGLDDEGDGRRGAGNIVANCLIGTVGAALEAWTYALSPDISAVVFVTGIAAGASDTVASEIGKAWGAAPRSFPTFARAAPGTPGAVSVAGTLAGIVATVVIAAPAIALWLLDPPHLIPVVIGCTAGAFVESTCATYLEARGWIGNHTLNLLNTAMAAAIAVSLAWVLT